MTAESGDGVDVEETYLRPVSDIGAISACYEQYGVVGVTGVLSQAECQSLVRDGLQPLLPEGCHVDDAATYGDAALGPFGLIGMRPVFNPAILTARLHPNVVTAFSAVYQRSDVVACHDRASWMRPTAGNPKWTTPFSWPGLHFDISLTGFHDEAFRPDVDAYLRSLKYHNTTGFLSENNAKHASMGRTVQGVLNLLDNEEEDGGFHCVPGLFGPRLRTWVEEHTDLPAPQANGRYILSAVGPDAEVGAEAVRVPCPAGTLLLFDATLPHGTRPNTSSQSRMVLYLRYLTPDSLPREMWKDRNAALRRIARDVGFVPDSRQAKYLFGPESS